MKLKFLLEFQKKYRTLKTNNGYIIEQNNKTIIIPERIGNCEIQVDVKLPSDEKIEFKNVTFNVTE